MITLIHTVVVGLALTTTPPPPAPPLNPAGEILLHQDGSPPPLTCRIVARDMHCSDGTVLPWDADSGCWLYREADISLCPNQEDAK